MLAMPGTQSGMQPRSQERARDEDNMDARQQSNESVHFCAPGNDLCVVFVICWYYMETMLVQLQNMITLQRGIADLMFNYSIY